MKTYKVRFTRGLYDKIDEIAEYISSINTAESGVQYANTLVDEILTLSYRLQDIKPRIFWDMELGTLDYERNAPLIIQRVLEYGDLKNRAKLDIFMLLVQFFFQKGVNVSWALQI